MGLPDFISNPDPDRYFTENYVCLDFEIDTSHGDFGHPVHPANQMLLACWSLGEDHPAFEEDGKVYSLWGNEYEMGGLVAHLNQADLLVAHQAKYELGWLARLQFDTSSIMVFDTKIAEYVMSGNLKVSHHLNDLGKRRGLPAKDPVVDNMMKAGVNPVEIPKPWLQGRCIQDVQTTEFVFRDQRIQLKRSKRLGMQYVRCHFSPVLADMEMQGMQLDDEAVRLEHKLQTEKVASLAVELQAIAGDINLNSDVQLAQFVYVDLGFEERKDRRGNAIRTPGGKARTDTDTLGMLKAKTKEQKEFIKLYADYNKSRGRLSKYLDFYLAVCNQQNGIFYASFNQTVTKTHRLSSSGMKIRFEGVLDEKGKERSGGTQFQNQPNEYKRLFKARTPDSWFTEEDGSGLEFRVAGIIGNDDAIKADINNPDFDPHTHSASIINQISAGEVDKEQRRKAKAHTFKPLFGGTSGTKGEKRYYDSFNERYSGLVRTQEMWLAEALSTKRLVLPWGMQFFYPYIRIDNSGYCNERTKVYNGPIQSFATGEIIPIQATILWHLIRSAGLQDKMVMVNTVHDSVLTEVDKGHMEKYSELVLQSWQLVYSFIEAVYGMSLEGLPLGTEVVHGTHWGSGEEHAFNVWKDKIEVA